MCGRVIQSSEPLPFAIVDGMNVRDSRLHNHPPRWNAAPSQELLVIRRNHKSGEVSLGPLRWGLIPNWCNDPQGGRKPINAKCETVHTLPTFRDAYRCRRCILPVDGFYEWMAVKGAKAKQPFAIAMKDGRPFGIGGIWENWREPASGEWVRTFAVITTAANELVGQIHDRMPLILAREDFGGGTRARRRRSHCGPRLWAVAKRGTRRSRAYEIISGRSDTDVACLYSR
jgi:putative SOS response-associated peptidase YedK